MNKNKFDILNLKGKLCKIRDWMKDHHFPPGLLFFLTGIISTIWFLIRVIPKPSRASYPLMQVAAAIMSGFVVYLISLGGITFALRKARQNLFHARYIAAGSFILVALESVCFDFLRTEWNGINKHNSSNNSPENGPNWNGVDDYLHQAADRSNWPEGISYDPDNSGKPLPGLGVHEHWNNAADKQYSFDLGKHEGIELFSIPDTLVKSKAKAE